MEEGYNHITGLYNYVIIFVSNDYAYLNYKTLNSNTKLQKESFLLIYSD